MQYTDGIGIQATSTEIAALLSFCKDEESKVSIKLEGGKALGLGSVRSRSCLPPRRSVGWERQGVEGVAPVADLSRRSLDDSARNGEGRRGYPHHWQKTRHPER